MRKHNYPRQRKARTTAYSKSSRLIQQVGADKLVELFSKRSIYISSRILSEMTGEIVSPNVVYYTRRYKLHMVEINHNDKRNNKELLENSL